MASRIFSQFGISSTSAIFRAADETIAQRRAVFDKVASLNKDDLTYSTVIKPMCESDRNYETNKRVIVFHQMVHPNKDIRLASTECQKKIAQFDVDTMMRRDVYDILLAYKNGKTTSLPMELEGYLDKQVKERERNGVHLSSIIQTEIKSITNRMNELCIDFDRNLNEDNTVLEFAKSELDGLNDEFIAALDKTELGMMRVTLSYPHYFTCMKKCKVPQTRAALERAFTSVCKDSNTPILEEIVQLREKKAKLLQYSNHADCILEPRMAKTAENVNRFLTELNDKLQTLREADIQTLLKFKEKECAELGIEFDKKINPWDVRYYMRMVEECEYNVNHEELREYFPMNVVTKGLMAIFQHLLGLTFKHLPHDISEQEANLPVWHSDVEVYEVKDSASGSILGYFYLDLYPRESKYGHACVEPLQYGCSILQDEDSSNIEACPRQIAVAAMITNFTKATKDQPSLLRHDEVETYFHEFGHLMHHICSQAHLSYFSGMLTQIDFIEAPSSMLENWCWQEEPLRMMSGHYLTGNEIPKQMLEQLLRSRRANSGIHYPRQISLALFDQQIHTNPMEDGRVDVKATYSKVVEKVLGIKPTPDTSFPARFAHLTDIKCCYAAAYYGYLWSEVFSMDMFMTRFNKEGIMNTKTGQDYRTYILEPGGSKDAYDMLKDFLGREPNNKAFLTSIGI